VGGRGHACILGRSLHRNRPLFLWNTYQNDPKTKQ
jgi:hypothetical protein